MFSGSTVQFSLVRKKPDHLIRMLIQLRIAELRLDVPKKSYAQHPVSW